MPWSSVIATGDVVAVHAALLPTDDGSGEILFFGGSDHDLVAHQHGRNDHTARFDCRRGDAVERLIVPVFTSFDVFCCGHAFLGDGRLLVAGGTDRYTQDVQHPHDGHWSGERRAVVYRPTTRSFAEVASMGFEPGKTVGGGRWYPSLCTLPTGEVLAVGGHPSVDDSRHNNDRPERYQPFTDRWTMLASITTVVTETDVYLRLHVLRDGTVFVSSPPLVPIKETHHCVAIDPMSGVRRDVCGLPDDDYSDYNHAAVLLPLTPRDGYRPRVLVCGGRISQLIDLGQAVPAWTTVPRSGGTASKDRRHGTVTILPTGDLLMNGGDGVMEPEFYATPLDHAFGAPSYTRGVGAWTTIAEPAAVPRNYHSTALLMPDGRVWTAGGNLETLDISTSQPLAPPGPEQEKIEIFDPPYPVGDRSVITACPRVVAYSEEFGVDTPQARHIRSVTLLRCGSSTHAFNWDQRCVFLEFRAESEGRLLVTAPPNGAVAPPGAYMLFLVDEVGRPCQYATFLRLGGRTTLVSDPWGKVVLADSSGAGPALASHDGRLFLAWKGSGNSQLNLMFSDDAGATFVGKRVLDETSDREPALASHGGRLLLAWVGEGNERLNVARVVLVGDTAGGFGIERLEGKVVLGDSSDERPALASHDGRLFLAWKGSGNSQLNLMFSDDGGTNFQAKRVLDETSDHGPALVSHGGRLLLTWAGESNEHLNLAPIRLLATTAGGFGIDGLDPKSVLDDSSEEAPALASHGGRLFLAWKGADNPQLNLMASSDGGDTFGGKRVFGDTTHHGTTLASHGGHLRLAWAGEGAEHLNVAAVSADSLDLLSEVRWAGRLVASGGGAAGTAFPPENVLGEPDGLEFQCFPGMAATYADFRGRHYPHLVELLGAETVTHGDSLTREQLARADVVAFERNGTEPAPGGGWESCDWTFATPTATVAVSWRSGAGAPRDPHVLANGSVTGRDYKRYFEVTHGSPMRDDEVISFLVITLAELRTGDPRFTIEVRGAEETPDIDVIGLLPR
jgi:Domain of unknown function (DUF1929)